ncbi:MAG: alkaline phosphatase [Flavobacteriaceae bacterium]|jgi:alkaline phosphatase
MRKTLLTLFFPLLVIAQTQQTADSPLNVILLIGDGMGLSQISAGMYANNNQTVLEDFSIIGLSKTHAINSLVTDSAASGTAMACGEKTYNGVLGISSRNQKLESVLEICEDNGYNTGLIANSSIVHATPASFYANIDSRKKYEEIALQLSESNVDYFIGGGKKYFNKREDNRNLIKEMDKVDVVKNFNAYKKSDVDRIGFFTYNDEPPSIIDGRAPLLAKYLTATLDKLDNRKEPFFLMVEGSQIDWGGHANDIEYITSEFIEFNSAIEVALNFAKNNSNTLVIVTADHETGGLAITMGKTKGYEIVAGFNTGGHSATMVPVFSYGKFSELFGGIYDNTQIFHKMIEALGVN